MDSFNDEIQIETNQKIYFLGFMANRLLQASYGWIKEDERDSYVNKRIDTTGIMMANLFRQYYGKVVRDMKTMIYKEINNGSCSIFTRNSHDPKGTIQTRTVNQSDLGNYLSANEPKQIDLDSKVLETYML